MKKLSLVFLFVCIISFGYSRSLSAEQQFAATSLPLLAPGKHISLIKGFNGPQPDTDAAMEARWNEALTKGMEVGRIQVSWSELEPQKDQYDKQFLEQRLVAMQADGLQPFVLITTIDSEGFTLPQDLVNPNSSAFLADDINLDDPDVLRRFNKLLDWVVPMIVSHGGWVLSVGNEPGNFLDDYPSAEQSFIDFLVNARDHSHSINPNLAITMTLAYSNIEKGETFHSSLLEQSDVTSFNYYAFDTHFFFENDPTRVNQELDQMLDAADDKYLILQELGAASGFEHAPSLMNASLAGQQQFFETVFAKMATEPRFKVAVVFQLVDWNPELVDSFYINSFIQAGLPQDPIERFAESLETTGLTRREDFSSKPAWTTVIDQIEKFSNE